MSQSHTLATIQFQANARGANAALDSLLEEAKRTRTEIEALQADLDKGMTLKIGADGKEFNIQERIDAEKRSLKQLEDGYKNLTKGAKAFEEVVKNIRAGKIENSSIQELNQAANAAELRLKRLVPSDADYKQRFADLRTVIDESRKQIATLATGVDEYFEKITKGGDTSVSEMSKMLRSMKELIDIESVGSDKANDLKNKYTALADTLRQVSEEEKRAAGAELLAKAEGGGFAQANMTQLTEVIRQLKEYQSVINDPKGTGAETFARTKEQVTTLSTQLATLKGEAEKVKTGFASADEAIAAFNRHMNEMPTERVITQAEMLAKAESERLRQAFEESTAAVDRQEKELDEYDKDIEESIERVQKLEAELAKIEQGQQKRRNALGKFFGMMAEDEQGKADAMRDAHTVGKWTPWARSQERRKREIREELDGGGLLVGARDKIENLKNNKMWGQMSLPSLRQEREERRIAYEEALAQEERLRSAEQARFEQSQQGQRMTREEMQQAIKTIEDEALTVDRTTEDGQKRWEGMRATIDAMNEELRTASGEWMSLQHAEELAATAGGDNFVGTQQQLSQATAALERHRETLVKTIQQKKRDGEATTEEEAKLKKLEKQLKDLKFEQDNFNMSHERMDKLLKKPKDAESIEELKAAIKRADGELRRMEQSLGKNNKRYQEMASDVKDAKIELGKMEQQSKATASSFEKAWSRLKTYVGLYVGAAVAMQKITSTMGDLMELSDKMGEVRKTTSFTADEVGRLSTALAKMDTRTTLTGLMELSAVAGQLGLKTELDVRGFTEAANMLMVALPEMGKEGATAMLKVALATGEIDKIRQQMQDGLVEGSDAVSVAMTKIGSTIDSLRANSAAAAPAITDFVKRVGAVGAQSGITIDQVAALGSTVDALGMRVEMSATALSRMIPAIKNNAFEIAKAIGVTPETIRGLFEAGRGMEAILMILQHIKDSGADVDGIEKMLSMGGMADIMKDLNQQGARAGIVFAGLSQNVDELRRQLGVAHNAYADNIAIQEEYNKMNDTTAAKWERLKNKIEETFVGDRGQSYLGWVIDKLRWVVDLLTGDNGVSAAIRSVILAITLLRVNIAGGLTGAIKTLYATIQKMSWVGWANLITSVGLAVWYLGEQLGWFGGKTSAATTAVGNLEKQLKEESARLEQTFRLFSKYNAELDSAKKNLEELTAANKDTAEAETALQKAQEKHDASIREINSKYGKYLGYLLSETSSAVQLAKARELINAKLRETITLKQKEAALGDVEQEYGSGVRKAATKTDKLVQEYFGGNYDAAARVSVAISEAAEKYSNDAEGFRKALEKAIKAERKFLDPKQIAKIRSSAASGGTSISDDDILKSITKNLTVRADGLREAVGTYNEQVEVTERTFEARANVQQKKTKQATIASLNAIKEDWDEALSKYQKASGEERAKLAVEVYKQQRAYANLYNNNKDYFDNDKQNSGIAQRSIERMKSYEEGLRKVAEEGIKAVDAAERAESIIQETDFVSGGGGEKNPWGNSLPAESTEWKKMTAEQLVARRKQMKDFVNAIQTDTDVESVLKEDAALKKAIEKGMSSDMRTVIEWYNTERLKIQDELHARHLTNTGDWMDPKKSGKKASKQVQDEMKYYLDELDAYYTERKAKIQEQRNDEQISEAEAWRRTLQNDAEWQQRRAELQELYAKKSEKVTKEEMDAIFDILSERTGDTVKFIEKDIEHTVKFIEKVGAEKGKPAMDRILGDIDLGIEQAFLRQRNAVGKQMDAIADIIEKERPFNGITKNLEDNLTKMGVLQADFEKQRLALLAKREDTTALDKKYRDEIPKRLTFMLTEAERAYNTNITEVMARMADAGMTAWADELRANPQMQEALMAQLRNTFDKIQEAVKKEASLWKKEAETMWNNIMLPDGQTLKQAADKAVAQLSLSEGRVTRANNLIGAGQASERVADKLAIQQMKIQLTLQEQYYALLRQRGEAAIKNLREQAELARQRHDTEKATRLELDAQHAEMALNVATSKEELELAKQREQITARTEEIQNRLYKEIKSYVDILTSGLQKVFEASNTGNEEYYNERAKLNLTGESGGAQQYIIIDNAGTEDATAHYETLSELEYLERKHEIEQKNAQVDAWKAFMDDLAAKMDETITDQINAWFQDQATDANTEALRLNTEALQKSTEVIANSNSAAGNSGIVPPTVPDSSEPIIINNNNGGGKTPSISIEPLIPQGIIPDGGTGGSEEGGTVGTGSLSGQSMFPMTDDEVAKAQANIELLWKTYTEQGASAMIALAEQLGGMQNIVLPPWQMPEGGVEGAVERIQELWEAYAEYGIEAMQEMSDAMGEMENLPPDPTHLTEDGVESAIENAASLAMGQAQAQMDASKQATDTISSNQQQLKNNTDKTNNNMLKSNESMWAKMTKAMNLYGVAYQAMANDNLTTEQKFEMIALQAAGNAAMAGLQVATSNMTAKTSANMAEGAAKSTAENGPILGPILFAVCSALIGGLMGLAMSKLSKAKSDISSVTGASSSASVGKLTTGMLTYAEGNVNEFTDPGSLQTGRSYNVDAADGRTYRARYMGANPRTHITNGPEFHLAGERGREMIIDAGTTKQIVFNEPAVMKAIETLSVGGRLRRISSAPRRGRGVAAFADGNIEDFEEMANEQAAVANGTSINLEALQSSLDRQSDLLEDLRQNGIKAHFDVYGKGGLIDSYDTGKKFVSDRDWPY